VSAIALLMGLLLLSYLGSLIVRGRATHGLPSGVEYACLGFVVGPHALGLVDRAMIDDFSPVIHVALGWLAFVVGLDFGRVEGRRVRKRAMVLGIACALITGLVVGLATFWLLSIAHVAGIERTGALVLAAGAGAVTAETTRFAVDWARARYDAKGPVSALLFEIAASDDLAPLVVLGAIFSVSRPAGLSVELPAIGWFGVSVALGGLLGTVTALLLRSAEGYAVWGALLGTLMLGVGTAERFGLCSIFVTFVMGVALAAASPARRVLRTMVGATERSVLLPMLLLAGARIDLNPLFQSRMLVVVIAVLLIARVTGKLLSGLLVRAAAAPALGKFVGVVLIASGPISISSGLVLALRFPGPIGDTLLVAAVVSAILGEFVSTFALKRLLFRIGEATDPAAAGGSAS